MTTWRFDSMCTRTLSMTISTRPIMARLSHRAGRGSPSRRTRAHDAQDQPHDDAQHEAADVREEGHAARGGRRAQRSGAADQLEHEPEAEADQPRDLEELVEE